MKNISIAKLASLGSALFFIALFITGARSQWVQTEGSFDSYAFCFMESGGISLLVVMMVASIAFQKNGTKWETVTTNLPVNTIMAFASHLSQETRMWISCQ